MQNIKLWGSYFVEIIILLFICFNFIFLSNYYLLINLFIFQYIFNFPFLFYLFIFYYDILNHIWLHLAFVMLRSHYHDQRHDWNRGLNRGLITSKPSYLKSISKSVYRVQNERRSLVIFATYGGTTGKEWLAIELSNLWPGRGIHLQVIRSKGLFSISLEVSTFCCSNVNYLFPLVCPLNPLKTPFAVS